MLVFYTEAKNSSWKAATIPYENTEAVLKACKKSYTWEHNRIRNNFGLYNNRRLIEELQEKNPAFGVLFRVTIIQNCPNFHSLLLSDGVLVDSHLSAEKSCQDREHNILKYKQLKVQLNDFRE